MKEEEFIEEIKKAFRAGRNSTDKFAKEKGFATNEKEYVGTLIEKIKG